MESGPDGSAGGLAPSRVGHQSAVEDGIDAIRSGVAGPGTNGSVDQPAETVNNTKAAVQRLGVSGTGVANLGNNAKLAGRSVVQKSASPQAASVAARAANASTSASAPSTPSTAAAHPSAVAAAVAGERTRANKLDAQLKAAKERVAQLEAEMADFSSDLMEEANKKVEHANRESAKVFARNMALTTQIIERDTLIEGQLQQLEVLKAMIAQEEATKEASNDSDHHDIVRSVNVFDQRDLADALDHAWWICPVRPTLRPDTNEYDEFASFVAQGIRDREEREEREREKERHGRESPYSWTSTFRSNSTAPDSSSSPSTYSASSWRFGRRHLTSQPFADRTITEEVATTLRLDQAAHLSWLNRRAWMAAIVEGTLEIEPLPSVDRRWASRPSYPCVLCGASGEGREHARLHVVKVPKDEQKFAIGNECLVRLRAACEYVSFLRSIFDGLRRLETPSAVYATWKECVRLRENLFWARVGGFYAVNPYALGDRGTHSEMTASADSGVQGPAQHIEEQCSGVEGRDSGFSWEPRPENADHTPEPDGRSSQHPQDGFGLRRDSRYSSTASLTSAVSNFQDAGATE